MPDNHLNQEKIKNLFLNEKYHQVRKLMSKLISVSPKNAELYSIRGRAFRCQHFYKKAHEDFMQAYLLDPNSIVLKEDAYQSTLDKTFNDLLRQYSDKSKKKQTITKMIELISTATNINTSLSNLKFEKLLLDLIAHKIPQQNVRGILFRAQSVMLTRLSEIEAFEKLNNRHDEEKNHIIMYFANDKLFRFILSADFNTNLRMELIIRSLRREIFLNFEKYRGISGIEKLVNSISKQVFLNEYIYDETKEESARIKHIQNSFSLNTGNKNFDINQVALLSMYQDISYLPNIETADFSPNFSEIKKTHIIDKQKESELATSLKKVSAIDDKTSKNVKKQYEENPYPRWNGVVERQPKRHPLKTHLEKFFNLKLNNSFFNKTQKSALIKSAHIVLLKNSGCNAFIIIWDQACCSICANRRNHRRVGWIIRRAGLSHASCKWSGKNRLNVCRFIFTRGTIYVSLWSCKCFDTSVSVQI